MYEIKANPSMYAVGGDVQASGGIYIPRRADNELLALCRTGTFSYVLTPRQMGKSSLMKRTVERLNEEGVRTVIIDLTQLGTDVTSESWHLGLLSAIEDQLALEGDVVSWWEKNNHLSTTQRMTDYFRKELMREVKGQVVICIDEIDTTLSLGFTDDFYAAIRYLHNARAHVPEFQRLSFVLIGVATPSDLMRDPQRTPFNIGERVDLTDFNGEEALPLLAGLGLPSPHAEEVLGWILGWTGGHPYLTLRLCRAIAQDGRGSWERNELDDIVAHTFFGEQAEKDNNLQFVRDMLTKRAKNPTAVLTTYLDILRQPGRVRDEEQSLVKSHLKLSGVVHRTSAGVLNVRNKIYRTVFNEHWVKNHLPATLKKQLRRTAIVSGATTMFAAIGILLLPLTLYAWYQKSNAEQAVNSERLARRDAETQRNRAEEAVGLERAARAEAVEQRKEAEEQRKEAEEQRQIAEQQTKEAERQRALAEELAGKETSAKKQAEARREEAQKQTENAEHQRSIAVAAGEQEQIARKEAEDLRAEAVKQEKLAKEAQRISQGGQLGAFAELTRNQQARLLKHSVLLAQESMIITPSEVGYQALSRGLALLPRPIASLPLSHPVQSVAFGKDRNTLITLRGDFTSSSGLVRQGIEAQLWTNTKPEVSGNTEFSLRFAGQGILQKDDAMRRSSLSPQGKYLAQVAQEKWEIVEMETGRKLPPLSAKLSSIPVFSPDSRYVATFNPDHTVSVWETSSLKLVSSFPNPSLSGSAAPETYVSPLSPFWENPLVFSATGDRIAITVSETIPAQIDKRVPARAFVRVYETATKNQIANLSTDLGVGVLFSPDAAGKYLATLRDGTRAAEPYVQIWDVSSQKSVARLFHSKRINRIVFSPDARYLATASDDFTARVWEIETAREVAHIIHEGEVTDLAFSPDGRYLATASADATARVWDWVSAREISRMIHQKRVNSVAFSPEGDAVATAGEDNLAQIWDVSAGTDFLNFGSKVTGREQIFMISPDGSYLVGVNQEGQIRARHIKSGRESVFDYPGFDIMFFSSNGKYLGAVTEESNGNSFVQWWDAASGRALTDREPISAEPVVAISPSGKYWVRAVLSKDDLGIVALRVIEKATAREMRLEGKSFDFVDDSTYEFVRFSGNEKYLLAYDESATLHVFDLEAGRELPFTASYVTASAFTPNGDYLAFAVGGSVHVRKMSTWQQVALLGTHTEGINRILFSPDGNHLATASSDNSAALWTVKDGRWEEPKPLYRSFTHEGSVSSVAFSRDQRYLATASDDNTTRVWEIATGREVARQTTDSVINIAFGPDDKYLAIAGSARGNSEPDVATSAQLWLWSPAALLEEACARLVPNLTAEDWRQYEEWHNAKIGVPPLKTCANLPTLPVTAP
ncbi:MAG: AAA-like domain-containing protein [Pyrinomonadaceae bacterium]|nr:AAA-like domain-containing protein [Pyrinomonadaceae bacterium]